MMPCKIQQKREGLKKPAKKVKKAKKTREKDQPKRKEERGEETKKPSKKWNKEAPRNRRNPKEEEARKIQKKIVRFDETAEDAKSETAFRRIEKNREVLRRFRKLYIWA